MQQLGFFDLSDHSKQLSDAGDPLEELERVIDVATQRCPGKLGELVGQGNNHDVVMRAGEQLSEPSSQCRLAFGQGVHSGTGAVDQERPQIDVATFADPEELRLAAGRETRRHRPRQDQDRPRQSRLQHETPHLAPGARCARIAGKSSIPDAQRLKFTAKGRKSASPSPNPALKTQNQRYFKVSVCLVSKSRTNLP